MGHKTAKTAKFDEWMRTRFVDINSELEEIYFGQKDRALVEGVRLDLKKQLKTKAVNIFVGS